MVQRLLQMDNFAAAFNILPQGHIICIAGTSPGPQ